MKDIIQKIADLPVPERCDTPNLQKGFIIGLSEAIKILKSIPVIKAKALRKKGTDMWYYWNGVEWGLTTKPMYILGSEATYKDMKYLNSRKLSSFPKDAELVTITIIVKGDDDENIICPSCGKKKGIIISSLSGYSEIHGNDQDVCNIECKSCGYIWSD